MDKVIIYCDGGCRGNQKDENIGGWGVVLTQGEHKKTLKGSAENTTNNQMELTAAIKALEAIKRNRRPIEVYVDSAYVVNGMTKWIENWVKKGWRTKDGGFVKNAQLWQRLLLLSDNLEDVQFIKVKGHAGIELNELADQLANEAMDNHGEVVF